MVVLLPLLWGGRAIYANTVPIRSDLHVQVDGVGRDQQNIATLVDGLQVHGARNDPLLQSSQRVFVNRSQCGRKQLLLHIHGAAQCVIFLALICPVFPVPPWWNILLVSNEVAIERGGPQIGRHLVQQQIHINLFDHAHLFHIGQAHHLRHIRLAEQPLLRKIINHPTADEHGAVNLVIIDCRGGMHGAAHPQPAKGDDDHAERYQQAYARLAGLIQPQMTRSQQRRHVKRLSGLYTQALAGAQQGSFPDGLHGRYPGCPMQRGRGCQHDHPKRQHQRRRQKPPYAVKLDDAPSQRGDAAHHKPRQANRNRGTDQRHQQCLPPEDLPDLPGGSTHSAHHANLLTALIQAGAEGVDDAHTSGQDERGTQAARHRHQEGGHVFRIGVQDVVACE